MNDVIVIGGGPAGSTAATLLAKRGHSVILLERDQFPRFQIGESLLPYNNDLFDRLGVRDRLCAPASLPKYGAYFVTGDGAVGHTFRFGRHLPQQYASSYQVRRSEFDDLLLRNALECGVDVRQRTSVVGVGLTDPDRVIVRALDADGKSSEIEARFVVDASGHATAVGRQLGTRHEEASLRKIAIFAHYRNVLDSASGPDAGNTVIVVLPDCWFWMIPLTDGITSVGLVASRETVAAAGDPEALLAEMIARTPYVAGRMRDAERTGRVYARKDFSYRVKGTVGQNYALAGDAAGFFDPIFSTGVFMAMKSADLAAEGVDLRLRTGSMKLLRRYERSLGAALERYFGFISRFYERSFLEVFLQPSLRFGLMPVVVGLLAGDAFDRRLDRWRIALFLALTRIQKFRPVIAPAIAWDTLPRASGSIVSEESFVRSRRAEEKIEGVADRPLEV
jgi:flavin-dependent dehydrogenase